MSSLRELQQVPLLRRIKFKNVLAKKSTPAFKPPDDHLNCDPSLELEEMIVEDKPLHKKNKRLAKQRSAQKMSDASTSDNSKIIKEFIVYNRYKELKRKAMELKENEWQEELNTLMANSHMSTDVVPKAQPTPECIDEASAVSVASTSAKEVVEPIEYIDRTPSPKSTKSN